MAVSACSVLGAWMPAFSGYGKGWGGSLSWAGAPHSCPVGPAFFTTWSSSVPLETKEGNTSLMSSPCMHAIAAVLCCPWHMCSNVQLLGSCVVPTLPG